MVPHTSGVFDADVQYGPPVLGTHTGGRIDDVLTRPMCSEHPARAPSSCSTRSPCVFACPQPPPPSMARLSTRDVSWLMVAPDLGRTRPARTTQSGGGATNCRRSASHASVRCTPRGRGTSASGPGWTQRPHICARRLAVVRPAKADVGGPRCSCEVGKLGRRPSGAHVSRTLQRCWQPNPSG